jgi:hypothetical protein
MKIRVMATIDFPESAPKRFGVVVPILIVTQSTPTRDSQTTGMHRDSRIATNHPRLCDGKPIVGSNALTPKAIREERGGGVRSPFFLKTIRTS